MSITGQPDQTTKVSWRDVEARVGDVRLTPTQLLGYKVFKVMVCLFGIMLLLVVLHAVATWPSSSEVAALLEPVPPEERTSALLELRGEWRDDLMQVVQLVIVGPLIPILSALIGYMLGRNPDRLE